MTEYIQIGLFVAAVFTALSTFWSGDMRSGVSKIWLTFFLLLACLWVSVST